MNLCASGINATIDLHAHHLVINRLQPGIFFGASDAEHLIPFSSIKSVQFVRPGFLAPGKIVLILASGSTVRPGSLNDPNTVLFTKKQLELFESVLRAIQNAIATPSIERLAIAAQQQRSIDSNQPTPESGELKRINPPSGTAGGSGHGGGSRTYGSQQSTNGSPASPKPKSWWGDMPFLGKIILVVFGTLFLLGTCDAMTSGPESSAPAGSNETGATAVDGLTSDQILSDWADFALGEARTTHFGLTDGSGQPGEFCSTSKGTAIMAFGPRTAGDEATANFDSFLKFDSTKNLAVYGSFSFDRAAGAVAVRALSGQDVESKRPVPANDFTMKVEQISPGKVSVDGNTFHYCIP